MPPRYHQDRLAPHPVVRLSFDGIYNDPTDIKRNILSQLEVIERSEASGEGEAFASLSSFI